MGFTVPVELRSLQAYIRERHGSDRQLSLAEARVLREFVIQIVADIADAWPVDTGFSSTSFEFTIQRGPLPDPIGFHIINEVEYAEFIHRRGNPALLWQTLIPMVIQGYGPRINAAMRAAIDRTEADLARTRRPFWEVLQDPNLGRAA